jgi:hypothetical protein
MASKELEFISVEDDDDEAEYGMDQTYSQRQASSNPLENALGNTFFQQSKVKHFSFSALPHLHLSASHCLIIPSSIQNLRSLILYLWWLVHF